MIGANYAWQENAKLRKSHLVPRSHGSRKMLAQSRFHRGVLLLLPCLHDGQQKSDQRLTRRRKKKDLKFMVGGHSPLFVLDFLTFCVGCSCNLSWPTGASDLETFDAPLTLSPTIVDWPRSSPCENPPEVEDACWWPCRCWCEREHNIVCWSPRTRRNCMHTSTACTCKKEFNTHAIGQQVANLMAYPF